MRSPSETAAKHRGAGRTACDLVAPLAEQTMAYPYKVWGYGEEVGLQGLLAAAEATGEAAYFAFVHGLIDSWVAMRPHVAPPDHVAPGRVLLDVYRQTGDDRLLEQAHRLAEFFANLPRTPAGAALHRPDHDAFSAYVYVDCVYVDAPFLCRLAEATGEASFFDRAADLLLGHIHVLRDKETGLFYHLYDEARQHTNGAFWGRGNGWALLGLIETLEALPLEHRRRAELRSCLEELAVALAALQEDSGHWHTVLDRPDTYLETSLAGFFCTGFTRAVQGGLLPGRYLAPADRAWSALTGCIDEEGYVRGVSRATPPGDAAHYEQVPAGGLFAWGQGPALLAAVARSAARKRTMRTRRG